MFLYSPIIFLTASLSPTRSYHLTFDSSARTIQGRDIVTVAWERRFATVQAAYTNKYGSLALLATSGAQAVVFISFWKRLRAMDGTELYKLRWHL